jgi:hypothetical protein
MENLTAMENLLALFTSLGFVATLDNNAQMERYVRIVLSEWEVLYIWADGTWTVGEGW